MFQAEFDCGPHGDPDAVAARTCKFNFLCEAPIFFVQFEGRTQGETQTGFQVTIFLLFLEQ